MLNGAARLLGRPPLPAPGERLRQAIVHPLAVAEETQTVVAELWSRLERAAARRRVDWLIVTLDARDRLLAAGWPRRWGMQSYATRLYAVHLPGCPARTPQRGASGLCRPEAAWL